MTDEARASLEQALPAYEIAGRLGEGAFGVVYEARHTQLGRAVAIKQLPRVYAEDEHVRERFVAEAQMVASLDHPHIVPVYDFVESEGSRYLIMERCEGSIADRFRAEGIVTDEACAAVLACLAGLDVAHAKGLLHRDVKPENLMYDTKGVVKLADFGIARDTGADTRRTATGMIVGTPAYMSPEQCRGDELTAASDVYSVGMMAYELLTGGLPFPESDSVNGLLAHHLVTEPLPLLNARPELPGAIGEVIDRSLAKDLGVRQATAEQFASELAGACVTAFGSGWLRRRRFVLHWPEIIAVTEQPAPNSPRTGTIMVKAGELTYDFEAKPPPKAPVPQPVATAAPTPTQPTQSAPQPVAATTPPANDASPGSGSKRPPAALLAVVGAALVALIAGIVVLTSGGDDETNNVATVIPTPTEVPAAEDSPEADASESAEPAQPADEAEPTAVPEPTADTTESADSADAAPPIADDPPPEDPAPDVPQVNYDSSGNLRFEPTEQPEGIDLREIAFPGSPRPCPENQERAACIWTLAIDEEEDTMQVFYWVEGFLPELEPAGYHLHFYIDSSVDGDETKAGSATPGGSWKLWDSPWPATSFDGENGRTLFTPSEFIAADGRNLCVLVADAEHRTIPGSGNCVTPLIQASESSMARFQASMSEGQYGGSCAMGVTAAMPLDWRWFDLTTGDIADTARAIRPTAAADTQELLELLVSVGGVMFADGPATAGGFSPNVSFSIWPGSFTMNDAPGIVRDELGQLGIDIGTLQQRAVGDREFVVGVTDNGNSITATYVIPDYDYAIAMAFTSNGGAGLQNFADQMALSVLGC